MGFTFVQYHAPCQHKTKLKKSFTGFTGCVALAYAEFRNLQTETNGARQAQTSAKKLNAEFYIGSCYKCWVDWQEFL